MATNNFLPFSPTDTGTNLLTQVEYAAATDRTIGNQPGVASSKLNNKALRQSAFITSQLAQWLSNVLDQNVLDDADTAALLAQFYTGFSPSVVNSVGNLAVTVSAGSVTIHGLGGTALSATNPAYFNLPSNTTGLKVRLKLTANVTLSPANTDGMEWGTTSGTNNWANDRPFYLYAINTDDTDAGLYLGISPNCILGLTPSSSTGIGYKGNPSTANTDSDILVMTSTNITSQTSKPVMLIGGLPAQKTTGAADRWTFSALNNFSGILPNPFFGSIFTLPLGQMGAATGTYMKANGGTAPVFSGNAYNYYVQSDGTVVCLVNMTGDGGTDGSGAVTALMAIPFAPTNLGFDINSGAFYLNLPSLTWASCLWEIPSGVGAHSRLRRQDQSAGNLVNGTTLVTNADFSNGARQITGQLIYKAFSS